MCRAVPEIQQARAGITAVLCTIRVLEEGISSLTPQETVAELRGVIEQLQQIEAMLANEGTDSSSRVTIQKFV